MKKISALFVIGIMFCSIVIGQDKGQPAAKPEGPQKPELTAADIEPFLDGFLPSQLKLNEIAGATVSVVKDGKLIFAKGYGYSDVASKKPVSPETTLFRPGSVSKLFTWTAVMQLVEQGKLDLNKDVNEYLDFKIPEAFGQPITLKHILTHTPGFEEQIKDLFTYNPQSPDLGQYVKTHIPTRVYPPGKVPAYSNYATALAGYIVERVSGQPFNDYIAEHIFKPLGMTHSTFAQPLPAELAPNMSSGYRAASGEAEKFEIVNAFPAGSLSSSATDMAKFMIAHLQGGQLGDARILKPETAKLMHSRLYELHPDMNGMAHGFYEEFWNGQRIIGHGGDTIFFHSDLHLMLDHGIGFFISTNSGGKNKSSTREVIWHAFLDRYFPYTVPDKPALDTAKQDSQTVAGNYIGSRRSDTSFFKSFALISPFKITANEDGTISVPNLLSPDGELKKYREVGPMLFQEVGGQDTVAFKPDDNGNMQLFLHYPFMIFQRMGIWDNGSLLLSVAGISLGVMALTLVLWFVCWWIRRHYGYKMELSPLEWKLRWIVRLVFLLFIIFVVAIGIFVTKAISNLDMLSDSGTKWLWLIQGIGALASIGTLIVFYNMIHTWLSKNFRFWGKLQATIFALACLGVLWLIFAGHLISFKSTY